MTEALTLVDVDQKTHDKNVELAKMLVGLLWQWHQRKMQEFIEVTKDATFVDRGFVDFLHAVTADVQVSGEFGSLIPYFTKDERGNKIDKAVAALPLPDHWLVLYFRENQLIELGLWIDDEEEGPVNRGSTILGTNYPNEYQLHHYLLRLLSGSLSVSEAYGVIESYSTHVPAHIAGLKAVIENGI